MGSLMLMLVLTNFIVHVVSSIYDPFDDSLLYEVSLHNINNEEHKSLHEVIHINTKDEEQYSCLLPSGDSVANQIDSDIDDDALSPSVLLEQVLTSKECVYLVEGYWSYELCHGLQLRQFHEDRDKDGKVVKIVEYILGVYESIESSSSVASPPPTWNYLEKDYPYYHLTLKDGSPCDIRGNIGRSTKLMFICEPNQGDIPSLIIVKETTTCEYEAVLVTQQLCKNKAYHTKTKPVHNILCQPLNNSPSKPRSFLDHELAIKELLGSSETSSSITQQIQYPFSRDDGFVNAFLSGDSCLQGKSSGWWQHELCFKKHVRQIHQEGGMVTQSIILGKWDEKAHKKWFVKAGKSKQSTNHVTHLYVNGDTCDITGKPRQVRVKFKCVKASSLHQISLFLEEVTPCNYLLTIEAEFLCDLLQTVNEYGVFSEKT